MQTSEQEVPRNRSWFTVGFVVSLLAAAVALGYMILTAIRMVAAGRGIESHRTFWLVEGNWVEFLVFVAAAVAALLVGVALRLRERREWNALQRKYGEHKNDA